MKSLFATRRRGLCPDYIMLEIPFQNPGITPIPACNNVPTLLTHSVCFCAWESDGRRVEVDSVYVCVWGGSVTLSVVLAALQSAEAELQLQALPPNGGK